MAHVDEGVEQDDGVSVGVDRRRFLRRGAITAAVAAAGAAAIARPAGATDGANIQIGSGADANNTGTTTTKLTGSQFQALNGNGNLSLVGQHDTDNAVGIEGRANVGAQVRLLPNALDLLGTDDPHVFQAGSLIADNNDILWYALENGAGADTGLHPISLTAAFLPVSPPIRAYDSRVGAPPATGTKGSINGNVGEERDVHIVVAGSNVLAVFVNLTVVATTGTGFLAMFSADEAWNPASPFSSINWFTNGQITANGVASAVDTTTGDVRIHAGGQGTTDFLIDVTGLWVI